MSMVDGLPVAEEKKKYVLERLEPVLEEMISDVLAEMPKSPIYFMIGWLRKRRGTAAPMKAGKLFLEYKSSKLSLQCGCMMKITQQKTPESFLSKYLLAVANGNEAVDLPDGYRIGHGCIGHEETGIIVRSPPLRLTPRSSCDILLYHYTDKGGYSGITGQKCHKHLRASYAERAHFGDGIYTTQHPPDFYGSQEKLLLNSYTNSADPAKQQEQIAIWRDKGVADYCVPIIVSRDLAVNVSIETTKEMQAPGHTRHHGPMRKDRDIWVVSMRLDGIVTHGFELLDSVYTRLSSSDFSMRQDAVEVLARHAEDGDERATMAVIRSLHDAAFNVRIAAIWAVTGARLSKSTIHAKLQELAQDEPVSEVLDAIKGALQHLEQKDEPEGVEC